MQTQNQSTPYGGQPYRSFTRCSIFIATFISLILSSCSDSSKEEGQDKTPKALKDDNSSYEMVSSRGNEDLVQSLYKEVANKTPELNGLEKQIVDLAESKNDSTHLFIKYDEKNRSFYQAANNHVEQIRDSVLKQRIKALIEISLTKYNSSVLSHNDILKSIGGNEILLNDLHLVLKITRTLPLMEKFQKDALPSTKPLQGYSKELGKTLKYADTLSKK